MKAMSGENDENLMTHIEILYRAHEKSDFKHKSAWNFLKGKFKWNNPESTHARRNRNRVTNEELELFGDDALPRPPGMHRIAKSQRSSSLPLVEKFILFLILHADFDQTHEQKREKPRLNSMPKPSQLWRRAISSAYSGQGNDKRHDFACWCVTKTRDTPVRTNKRPSSSVLTTIRMGTLILKRAFVTAAPFENTEAPLLSFFKDFDKFGMSPFAITRAQKGRKDDSQSNSKVHRTLYVFTVFEVAWKDMGSINYPYELQRYSTLLQQHAMHIQLGMSSSGGFHMLQNDDNNTTGDGRWCWVCESHLRLGTARFVVVMGLIATNVAVFLLRRVADSRFMLQNFMEHHRTTRPQQRKRRKTKHPQLQTKTAAMEG
nr:hypothetical protein [Tanacetum cinerariifolium]